MVFLNGDAFMYLTDEERWLVFDRVANDWRIATSDEETQLKAQLFG